MQHLPQYFSSEASPQSSLLSHTNALAIHFRLAHLNWVALQPLVITAHVNSSDLSWHWGTPSHTCHLGMHTLSPQRNCVWRQLWAAEKNSKNKSVCYKSIFEDTRFYYKNLTRLLQKFLPSPSTTKLTSYQCTFVSLHGTLIAKTSYSDLAT